MSRINTNVTATVAVNTLNKNNTALNTSLERLSTGYRINSGKDDPAGLIASESLKSEQKATETAISNAQRADNIIGLGPTSTNAFGRYYFQSVYELPEYTEAVNAGRFPVFKGYRLNDDERVRRDVIFRIQCRQEVDIGAVEFGEDRLEFVECFGVAGGIGGGLSAHGCVSCTRLVAVPVAKVVMRVSPTPRSARPSTS